MGRFRAVVAGLVLLACLALGNLAQAQQAGTFMWRASKGQAVVHLLGSLHMADATLYPVDPAVNRAFLDSTSLAVEVDVSPEKLAAIAPQMDAFTHLPHGQTLADVLSPDAAAKVSAFLGAHGLPSRLMLLKPLGLMATLSNQRLAELGYSTNYGVDEHFLRRARAAGMAIHELESLEFQLNMDQELSPAVQEAVLLQSLDELGMTDGVDKVADYTKATLAAWKQGDVAEMTRLTFEDRRENPELEPFYELLFDRRNVAMARGVEAFLDRGEKTFVVVGAGHLVGPASIVELLRQRGVTCEQVPAMAPGNSSPARNAQLPEFPARLAPTSLQAAVQ